MSNQIYIELTIDGAKGIVVERKSDSVLFKQLRWHPFVGGWDGLSEPQQLAGWLKSWLTSHKKITLVVPRQIVLSRTLKLPSEDITELRRMVSLQLGEHIPYALEEVVWDISITGISNGFAHVMIWVVQQKELLRWIDPMIQAGFKVEAVTLNISGLTRQIKKYQLPAVLHKWQILLIVDVANTECVFIKDNQYVFVRSLDIGFKDLQQPADDFCNELILTMKDFLKNETKENIGSVTVVSAVAIPAWFEDWCARQSLSYQFIESNLVARAKKCVVSGNFNHHGISLAAINGLVSGESKELIRLMPILLKKRDEDILRRQYLFQAIGLFIIAGICVLLAWQMPIIQGKLKLSRLTSTASKYQQEVKKIDQVRNQLEMFRDSLNSRITFAQIAKATEMGLEGKVYLNTMSINSDKQLTLEGYGREGVDLDAVQTRLSSGGIFKDINLEYVNKRVTQEGQWVYFRMTMIITAKEE